VCQVQDGALALREFARCVRPGGAVLVNVPAFKWLWSYHDDTCETQHRYTRPELAQLFADAGIEVEFATYTNMLPLPLVVARRKLFRPANPTSDVQLYPAPIEAGFAAMAKLEHGRAAAGRCRWEVPCSWRVASAGIDSDGSGCSRRAFTPWSPCTRPPRLARLVLSYPFITAQKPSRRW
jgi:hypothetical protein